MNDTGTLMSAFVGDEIVLFDTATGRVVNSRFTGAQIFQSAFSPDGSRIAVTSDRDVAVLDAFSLNELIRDRAVLSNPCPNESASQGVRVLWSPDSNLVLVDRNLLDSRTLSPVGDPVGCEGVSFGRGATPSFAYVVLTPELLFDSVTVDVRSLPVSTTDLRARGCDLAGRDFTQSEWERFNPGVAYTPTCPH
jgi:hypothetical protein